MICSRGLPAWAIRYPYMWACNKAKIGLQCWLIFGSQSGPVVALVLTHSGPTVRPNCTLGIKPLGKPPLSCTVICHTIFIMYVCVNTGHHATVVRCSGWLHIISLTCRCRTACFTLTGRFSIVLGLMKTQRELFQIVTGVSHEYHSLSVNAK